MFFTKDDFKKIEEYLKLNSKKDTDFALVDQLKDEDILTIVQGGINKTIHIKDILGRGIPKKSITKDKLAEDVLFILNDLQNQIDSLDANGIALSQKFGNNPHIGISQKTLTTAINKIWDKLSEITGELYNGITMVVTPKYYTGNDGCKVHIIATPGEQAGMFEEITFYVNGIELCHDENIESFVYDFDIEDTTKITCVAKILGIEYTKEKIIYHHDAFWIGFGDSFADVMNIGHIVALNNENKASVSITCNEGDSLYIVIGAEKEESFTRADMNGIEIPFIRSTVTIDTTEYVIYTSENTYQAGTYNIDINS